MSRYNLGSIIAKDGGTNNIENRILRVRAAFAQLRKEQIKRRIWKLIAYALRHPESHTREVIF